LLSNFPQSRERITELTSLSKDPKVKGAKNLANIPAYHLQTAQEAGRAILTTSSEQRKPGS
jgi:hypothetical protein